MKKATILFLFFVALTLVILPAKKRENFVTQVGVTYQTNELVAVTQSNKIYKLGIIDGNINKFESFRLESNLKISPSSIHVTKTGKVIALTNGKVFVISQLHGNIKKYKKI